MKKTNVVFILADDMGYWAIGKNNKEIITPNLDKLCNNGLYFDNFYCASPVCSPARASILTGLIPSCHGVHDWIRSGNIDKNDLPDEYKNLPIFSDEKNCIDYTGGYSTYIDLFKNSGYVTALSGKWHLGDSIKCGKFDFHSNIARGGCSYYNSDYIKNGKVYFDNRYITDVITDDAINFINNNNEKPFYLSVHYTAPHSPWDKNEHPQNIWQLYNDTTFDSIPNEKVHKDQILTAPVGFDEKSRKENLQGYFTAITAMDNCIGKIIDCLEKNNLYDNTLIMFTSDNGMNMGHHGIWGKGNGTYPQNLYETSVKVPFIAYHKDFQNGITIKDCCSHYDIYPTFKEMLKNQDMPTTKYMCGKSFFKKLYKDKNISLDSDVYIISEYGKVRMLREKKYKLILNSVNNENFLFDLENDIDEINNLYYNNKLANTIKRLTKKLNHYFDKYSNLQYTGLKQDVYGIGQLESLDSESKKFKDNIKFYYN